MDLKLLQKKIPYKWKPQGQDKNKTKWSCVAYIDARDVMDVLDEVVGVENWQKKFYQVKNTMCCSIGIKIDNEWIWKDDGGSESDYEKEKGEVSDAFKRAGVNWGIGRFLYDMDIVWLTVEEYDANKYKLTEYIENRKKPQQTQTNISQTHTNPHEEEFKKTLEEGKCEKCGIKISENVKRFSLKAYNVERCMQCQKELTNNK